MRAGLLQHSVLGVRLSGWLWFISLWFLWVEPLRAELAIVPSEEPLTLFGGGSRVVPVTMENQAGEPVEILVSYRLLQAASTTAVRIRDSEWKSVNLLGRQTVLESCSLDLPSVAAPSRFFVQWFVRERTVIGVTALHVYPPDLLSRLKSAAGGRIDVWDPDQLLAPALREAGFELKELAQGASSKPEGRLAVLVEPGEASAPIQTALAKEWTRRGIGVVCIMAPRREFSSGEAAGMVQSSGRSGFATAPRRLFRAFAENPSAQLLFIELCERVLHTPEDF